MNKLLLFALLSLFFLSCIESYKTEEYPLPDDIEKVFIKIGQDNFNELQKGTFLSREFAVSVNEKKRNKQTGKIRLQGGLSRLYPKKTYKLTLYDGQSATTPQKFQLSAQYNDDSFSRYVLTHYLFKKAGFPVPELKPVHLFFDDTYHGIYLKIEIIDESFFTRRNSTVRQLFKANNSVFLSAKNGIIPDNMFKTIYPQYSDFAQIDRLISLLDRGIDENSMEELQEIIDLDNVLRYIAVSFIIGHYDGIIRNYYFHDNPTVGKLQFVPWDFDLTFYDGVAFLRDEYKNNLFEQIYSIKKYREEIYRLVLDIFEYDELISVLHDHLEEVEQAVLNDPYLRVEKRDFHREVDVLRSYLYRYKILITK